MPSKFEPGGIVQHEFLCAGTPVIASATGGLKDSIFQVNEKTQEGNGFLFFNSNPADFYKAILTAIQFYRTNPDVYAKIRKNSENSLIKLSTTWKSWVNEFYRLHNKVSVLL